MRLKYIGGGRFVPGWPTADHDEPDDALAAAKLASELYVERQPAARASEKARATRRARGGDPQ